MDTYRYSDLDGEHVITGDQIIKEYFPYWSSKMRELGRENLICRKNCIEDFCVIHWAYEFDPKEEG